ncbi:MAG: hypothetical protein IKP31_03835 [Lachnospiraceae bacterium]|nr:hypothetical protein [Lachnospiraceae bacterium]
MKRLLIFTAKCILALVPLIAVVAYTFLNPMGYMDEEYPSWHYTKMVQEGREATGIGGASLILGDSRAMADLVPEMLGEDYVNLGIGGATSVEMYYTLEHYITNNGVPKRVVIMFAPFHYSYMDNYETRTMYFHHLTFSEAMNVYSQGRSYGAEVLDDFDRFDILSMYLRLPDSYLPALINSRGNGRLSVNRELYERQVSDRGHALYGTADGCDDINYEANYTEMNRGGEHLLITHYFERLLKLCSRNGIDTVVLQPPMNEASYSRLDPGYVREYAGYINRFANDNPEILFETDIPCYDNMYFGDSSHLNEKGAKLYTEEFIGKYIKHDR